MTEALETIARLMEGWQERFDPLEWSIIADCYRDLNDDKNEGLWRRRCRWWHNLILALSWTLGCKVGNGVATPLAPWYVNFRLCKRSVYVDVNDPFGNIIPCPERLVHRRYWKWVRKERNFFLRKCLDLILALEQLPEPPPAEMFGSNLGVAS